jgi:hypothetical protein
MPIPDAFKPSLRFRVGVFFVFVGGGFRETTNTISKYKHEINTIVWRSQHDNSDSKFGVFICCSFVSPRAPDPRPHFVF